MWAWLKVWTLVLLWVSLPQVIFARGLVPCGGSGEEPCQTCHVVQLVNGVIEYLLVLLGIIAAIIIVYAGARLVTANGNSHVMQEAKGMITSMAIGYVIILGAWLLVDTGMKMLLTDGSTELGVWNQVQCVTQPEAEWVGEWSNPDAVLAGTPGWNTQPGVTTGLSGACDIIGYSGAAPAYDCSKQISQCLAVPGTPTVSPFGNSVTCAAAFYQPPASGSMTQCSPSNSACSVSALMGVGLSAEQANVMSCIAITESSGNPNTPPYNQANPGSNSTACGTFQIVRTTWNGAVTGACSDFYSNCQNAQCNMQVMATLVQRSGYSDWTCAGCNNKASACVSTYSN